MNYVEKELKQLDQSLCYNCSSENKKYYCDPYDDYRNWNYKGTWICNDCGKSWEVVIDD